MSSPKKKVRGFRDKLHVYSTKAGSQYVRPSDVILSEDGKAAIRTISKVFGKSAQNGFLTLNPAAETTSEKKVS